MSCLHGSAGKLEDSPTGSSVLAIDTVASDTVALPAATSPLNLCEADVCTPSSKVG
jgi:hypothetical protein